jgi:hypothetical protein
MEPSLDIDLALQTCLQPRPAPADLRRDLLRAARRADRVWIRWVAAAAFLLAATGLGTWRLLPLAEGAGLAEQAYGSHAAVKRQASAQKLPPGEVDCPKCVSRQLGFPAPLPVSLGDCPIREGAACAVGSRPAAFYSLDRSRSLYVFQAPLRGESGPPGRTVSVSPTDQARIWNEDGRGHILLEPRLR